MWSDPWPHDYWVALGRRDVSVGVVQSWRLSDSLDAWPRFDAEQLPFEVGGTGNAQALADVLAAATPLEYDHARVLDVFMSWLEHEPRGQGARAARTASPFKSAFVRAWLRTSIGTALAALVLTPTEDTELLGTITRDRLKDVWELRGISGEGEWLTGYGVEALYTADWRDGEPLLVPTHQGQGPMAREEWRWLEHDLGEEELLEAVQATAGLLVSPAVLDSLLAIAAEKRAYSSLAFCVLRRWALTLRALAWLERANAHRWVDVRRTDVVAFALASLGPWWPRPWVAISHRSADAKAALVKLRLWNAPAVAIDATTVPIWESNTGFVWRLIAATPAVLRVRTANYVGSTWCRREAELTQYLLERSDFMTGRVVLDGDLGDLEALDESLAPPSRPARPPIAETTFPPTTLALQIPSCPPLIVDVLAAVATLRLLNVLVGDPTTANLVARGLVRGARFDLPAPTNDASGWDAHYAAFGALAAYANGDAAPVRLAHAYPEEETELDLEAFVHRLPDLTHISCGTLDVLAALEWDREVRRWFSERWGLRTLIDFREVDSDGWTTDRSHALERGALEFRTREAMLFLLQNADQAVDAWQGPARSQAPILTQYLDDQFGWLVRCLVMPTWIVAYTALPSLEFDDLLVEATFSALAGEFAATPGLSVPREYTDVFGFDRDEPFVQRARDLGADI